MNMGTTSLDATNEAYQKRVANLAAANKGQSEEVEDVNEGITQSYPVEADDDEAPEEPVDISNGTVSEDLRADEPTPDMSWKKEQIIDHIEESDVDGDRDDLEKLTKTQLIELLTEG